MRRLVTVVEGAHSVAKVYFERAMPEHQRYTVAKSTWVPGIWNDKHFVATKREALRLAAQEVQS